MREIFYYIVPLIYYFAFLVLYSNNNRVNNYTVVLPFIIAISAFISTRGSDAGYDTKIYVSVIDNLGSYHWFDLITKVKDQLGAGYEFGFWYLNKLSYSLYPSSEFVFFVIVFLSSINFLLAFTQLEDDDKTKRSSVSFLFFLSCGSFYSLMSNTIRQGLSLSFFMLGLAMFVNGKRLYSLMLILIGISCHYSSILLYVLVLMFLAINLKFTTYIILIISSLALHFLGFSNQMMSRFSGAYGKLDANYLLHPAYLVGFFYMYVIYDINKQTSTVIRWTSNIYLGFFALQSLFLSNANTFNRIGFIRFILEPLLLYYFCKKQDSKYVIVVVPLLLCLFHLIVLNSSSVKFNLGVE